MSTTENQIELDLIAKLDDLKYTYRPDIRDRTALEANFREKFEALNRIKLTDGEFQRLLDTVITADVYKAAQTLRSITAFERDDGTPLNYTLVNIKDWCKNHFEVVNQLRINTDNSYHRYDVMLLINGVPVVQIELKTLAVSPRRAMTVGSPLRKSPRIQKETFSITRSRHREARATFLITPQEVEFKISTQTLLKLCPLVFPPPPNNKKSPTACLPSTI